MSSSTRPTCPLAIAADLAASGVSLLGVVFLSGFLSQLVGEAGHGREHARVRDILRHLSWRRLILADLLVVLLVVIGLIALVIPGLILINLFAVVGPVVEIENRPVFAALRRSARLSASISGRSRCSPPCRCPWPTRSPRPPRTRLAWPTC